MALLNRKVTFSVEGLIFIRSNSDGTPIRPGRLLGFAGTVDLSGFGSDADLVAKIDSGAEDTQNIDWSLAVDPAAVTVAEFVTYFNAAGFTDLTASADTTTTRLKIVYSGVGSPTFIQLYDNADAGFAAALDIGQGQRYGGVGAKYIVAFDNTVGVNLPQNIKDKEEYDTESGSGKYTSIVIEQITKGYNPVITMNTDDFALRQLIMGGVYNETINLYSPPTTDQTEKPIFTMEVYHDIYNQGAGQPRPDKVGVKRIILPNCTGNFGDIDLATKTIPNYTFNLTVGEWYDSTGFKRPYETQQNLTIEEFNALDVENL